MAAVAQLVRASGCGPEGRGFEPRRSPFKPAPISSRYLFPGTHRGGIAMEDEFDPLRMLAGLRSHGVTYVLVGGLASAARGSTITLDDVDIVIPPADEENLGNLGLALAQLGAEPIGEDDAHRSSYLTAVGQLDVIELGEAYDGLAER